jgi:steroid 5-alpha reductase family enzyme
MYELDSLVFASLTCLGFSFAAFISSSLTGNYSFVDRHWSILPFLYAWIFTLFKPVESIILTRNLDWSLLNLIDQRSLIISILTTLWGLRLTANFARKGGYQPGEEDYRWPILRKIITSKFAWVAFNFFFIVSYNVEKLSLRNTKK